MYFFSKIQRQKYFFGIKIGIFYLRVLYDRSGRQVCTIYHKYFKDIDTYFIICIYTGLKQKNDLK